MRVDGFGHRGRCLLIALSCLALAACRMSAPSTGSGSTSDGTVAGGKIEVVAVWSGVEQARFEQVLRAFERNTGASVTYTSAASGVPQALAAKAQAHDLPDIAFLPQPGLLRGYADRGWIVPLDRRTEALANNSYGTAWQRLAAVDGRPYGVWFKAANKSVMWYNVALFERSGLVPPVDVDGLLRVAKSFSTAGVPAFSVGGADGWTLTDWFEILYLRLAGADRYDQLVVHHLPWTDPSVKDTLRVLGGLLSKNFVAGGVTGALQTTYAGSVANTFAATPAAAMVFEGDFVAGFLPEKARLGVDADVFSFPVVSRSSKPDTAVVGGGDLAVLMRSSAAGTAFMQFLATPEAAALWAAHGGFLSPNINLDLSVYPDDTTRSMARALLDAGSGFHFDLSDQQPGDFGSSTTQGMPKRLQDFLVTGDVDGTAAGLEADARVAFGR